MWLQIRYTAKKRINPNFSLECGTNVAQCEHMQRGNLTSPKKEKKTLVVRARCDQEFKTLLSRAASTLGLDESDVVRLAVRQYVARYVLGNEAASPEAI